MSSKSEPPISRYLQGWTADQHRLSLQKSFHFSSETLMKDFCLSILTSNHDKSTNLSAIECPDTHDIKVEVFARKSFQKQTLDIIRTIESCYQETQQEESSNDGKKHSSAFWFWWFKGFGK